MEIKHLEPFRNYSVFDYTWWKMKHHALMSTNLNLTLKFHNHSAFVSSPLNFSIQLHPQQTFTANAQTALQKKCLHLLIAYLINYSEDLLSLD